MALHEYTTGKMNYVHSSAEEQIFFTDQPERTNLKWDTREVPIHDIRSAETPPSLAREGFLLARLPLDAGGAVGGAVGGAEVATDGVTQAGQDIAALAAAYHPPLLKLMQELTGAPKIVMNMPRLRFTDRAPAPGITNAIPGRYVHCDFEPALFHQLAADAVKDDPERDRWLSGRHACIQTWRALSPPPQDLPLAVIDRSTVAPQDLVPAANVIGRPGEERKFEHFIYRYNSAHRWWFISNMTCEDVLVFLGFDSADEKMPGTPHAAFDYWESCPETRPRVSCELRAFVYWG